MYFKNLSRFTDGVVPELEVRFGTKKIRQISKIDFYNVIKCLMSHNFKLNSDTYTLKIISDNENHNIRTQISGLPNIQNYCKFNNLTSTDGFVNIPSDVIFL